MQNDEKKQPNKIITKQGLVNKLTLDEIYNHKMIQRQKFYGYFKRYFGSTPKSIERVAQCGTYLEFLANSDMTEKKIHKANFCGVRMCPYCEWRRSLELAEMLTSMTAAIKEEYDYEFLFITLTAPAVKSNELDNQIRNFNKAFNLFIKRTPVKRVVKGAVRKLEVTYNQTRDWYHPHFHVLVAVNKSYFNSRNYIKQDSWLKMWRESMKDESITNVDVRKAVTTTNSSALVELAKYTAKPGDVMGHKQEVFDTYLSALKNKRMISYLGIFKEMKIRYENDGLTDYIEIDETDYVWLIRAVWDFYKREYGLSITEYRDEDYHT